LCCHSSIMPHPACECRRRASSERTRRPRTNRDAVHADRRDRCLGGSTPLIMQTSLRGAFRCLAPHRGHPTYGPHEAESARYRHSIIHRHSSAHPLGYGPSRTRDNPGLDRRSEHPPHGVAGQRFTWR
jgi:hypothetical protein